MDLVLYVKEEGVEHLISEDKEEGMEEEEEETKDIGGKEKKEDKKNWWVTYILLNIDLQNNVTLIISTHIK